MKRLWLIAVKDLRLAFRDRAALLFLLVAPFALIMGMALISGRLTTPSGSNTGIRDIPVWIINEDGAELGNALVEMMTSSELADLLEPQVVQDVQAARQAVNEDRIAGVVRIPAGFTRSIIPAQSGNTWQFAEPVQIEFYANPSRPTSAGIVEAILREFLSRVEAERIKGNTAIVQMLQSGILPYDRLETVTQQMSQGLEASDSTGGFILQIGDQKGREEVQFDIMSYMAPGMALMFLMFTASYGGRSFLAERRQHTLQRLLTTPTSVVQIFGGKMLGIFLTGVAQVLILIGTSTLIFGLKWGDALGVLALVLCATFAATGWGLLITAFSRTPGQVSVVGSVMMLVFGILGGSFINTQQFPPFLLLLSRVTPNAWGLDGFAILANGGRLADLSHTLTGLLVMGGVLFAVSVWAFSRNRQLLQS
ncbi:MULTISPECIES: ABC transporter permease [Anaerolinea]|uniref:ABC transporter permease n=1 Tax=Anaerolinea TaxID=233189 RepID=UPI00260B37CA|nr:ABC transporter permease [Anaerolinea thermophila]